MEGKSRLGARNWEFSNHTSNSDSVLEPALGNSVPDGNAPGYQSSLLKMNAYSNRSALIDESDHEASSMEFSWFTQRSFLSTTHDLMHHVNEEVNDVNSMEAPVEGIRKNGEVEGRPLKIRKQQPTNRIATKALRPKEAKKNQSVPRKKNGTSVSTGKREKRNQDNTFEDAILDFSGVPAPVCSCTGVTRQCYRWGAGGWQSSCCTTNISEYPLPMSSSRPSARLAGRKMNISAYGKLLQRLANEGHDLAYAVDLKDHWARHGTNKFVTIRPSIVHTRSNSYVVQHAKHKDNILHIFIECDFMKDVWSCLSVLGKGQHSIRGFNSLSDIWALERESDLGVKGLKSPLSLITIGAALWNIWRERNNIIFKGGNHTATSVAY